MLKGLVGKKMNMTAGFDSHGRAVPLTKIVVEPNVIVSLKTKEKNGYRAVEVGIGQKKKTNRALSGHFKKSGLEKFPARTTEIAYEGEVKAGSQIKLSEVFHKGVLVDVVGTSKGKGFAGGMKRHGFHGGPKTHGQSDRQRSPGSIGAGTTPGRVFKGTKMAGHMGSERTTVVGLQVMEIDVENNIMTVKGSIPGAAGSALLIKKSSKKPKAYHEPEIPNAPQVGGEKEETGSEETNAAESSPEIKAVGEKENEITS